jgi:hypothetical protein
MAAGGSSGRFSALLLEGLDHYRKGRMLEAVRAWEEAYLLEPTNLRAREFLRSALERIHAHMGPGRGAPAEGSQAAAPAASAHPWLPGAPAPAPSAADLPPPSSPWESDPFAPTPSLAPALPPLPPEAGASPPPSVMAPPGASNPAPQSPWDDGPSVAIPQQEASGGDASGAWGIHKEALPIEAVADDETEVWMRGARELVALNDFSGTLELLAKILEKKPGDKEAQQMHELCEHNLTLMFESKIGSMDGRPRMAIPPDEVIWLNLDPRAGFVLAQIDGEVSFDDLYAICGLKRLDTARILCQLLEEGVVQVQGQDRAVAKRAMHRS